MLIENNTTKCRKITNMDYKWADICQDLLNFQRKKCTEREYQNCIYSIFRYYLRWQNNIVAEETIPIGSVNTIRPDFVLYKDDIPCAVIESKEPNHIQTTRNKEQLFSYMRQKKVDFGLYIGEKVELYYDVPSDAEMPLLIFSIELSTDSQYGQSFVKLFNYDDFGRNVLTSFCDERIKETKQREQLETEVLQLFTGVGSQLCIDYLTSYFIAKGYSKLDVEQMISGINVVITRKCSNEQTASNLSELRQFVAPNTQERVTSKTKGKFSVDGKGAYYKNRSALELVKCYLERHPSTWNSLESLFNGRIPHLLWTMEEIEEKRRISKDERLDIRWHLDTPLYSSDGVNFFVSTQVGDKCSINFIDIVSLSEELGIKIEPII